MLASSFSFRNMCTDACAYGVIMPCEYAHIEENSNGRDTITLLLNKICHLLGTSKQGRHSSESWASAFLHWNFKCMSPHLLLVYVCSDITFFMLEWKQITDSPICLEQNIIYFVSFPPKCSFAHTLT